MDYRSSRQPQLLDVAKFLECFSVLLGQGSRHWLIGRSRSQPRVEMQPESRDLWMFGMKQIRNFHRIGSEVE